MSTRALIRVFEGGQKVVTIYHHHDGYPTYLGARIKEVFAGRKVVNGISDPKTQINGMDAAAAMLIANLASPKETGGVYIIAGHDGDGEEWNYDLSAKGSEVHVTVYRGAKVVWSGRLDDLDPEEIEKNDN